MLIAYVSSLMSTILIENDKIVPGQEKYNMATFMVLFLLITIEVVVVKVVTADLEQDDDSHPSSPLSAAARFFDAEEYELWSSTSFTINNNTENNCKKEKNSISKTQLIYLILNYCTKNTLLKNSFKNINILSKNDTKFFSNQITIIYRISTYIWKKQCRHYTDSRCIFQIKY